MFETKASYFETMLQAAITHQLRCGTVTTLVLTVLSVMASLKVYIAETCLIAKPLLNDSNLLQSVLGTKQPERSDATFADVVGIIRQLYFMNPPRNSNPSVLIGVLGLYDGSTSPTDMHLMEIMKSIDSERALNLHTSSDTWNAFRNRWSRSHVESLSSSLEHPFPLIDPDEMHQSLICFRTRNDGLELENSSAHKSGLKFPVDPEFWLSVIAYCFEKCKHFSELAILLDNFSVAYTFMCLSSESEQVRKMAGSILIKWERLCEVFQHRGCR
jgi:hypothetical protein